jgi:ribosomal protein L11 methyltransferase
MSWWAIDVRTVPERRDDLTAWLVARTGQAVEEQDDGTLVTFAPDEQSAEALVAELEGSVDQFAHTVRRRLDPVDWSVGWRHGLSPRRFGRLTVVPSWLAEASTSDDHTVVLDPESAFGSGEHGSTRAALTLLEQLLKPEQRVLDLGSGSGILSIAAVKLGAGRAIGIEIDAEANEVASRNAERNGVLGRVGFLDGDAGVLAALAGPAEVILSNILRTANTALLPTISAALAPDGIAIFSGMEQNEAPEFREALDTAGFRPIQETVDSGWWAVAARRERREGRERPE